MIKLQGRRREGYFRGAEQERRAIRSYVKIIVRESELNNLDQKVEFKVD